MSNEQSEYERQWRDYRTENGVRPVREFLFSLSDEDRAAILEEMEYVREHGRLVDAICVKISTRYVLPIIRKSIASFLLVKGVLITYSSL